MNNIGILAKIIVNLQKLASLDVQRAVELFAKLVANYSTIISTLLSIAKFVMQYIKGEVQPNVAQM